MLIVNACNVSMNNRFTGFVQPSSVGRRSFPAQRKKSQSANLHYKSYWVIVGERTEKVFDILSRCKDTFLNVFSTEVPVTIHELIRRRFAVLEVCAQLRKREMSICGCSSGSAGCAGFGSHLDVDGIARKVRDRLVPDLLVEYIRRAKFGVLTTDCRG